VSRQLEAHLTKAESSTATVPARNTAQPWATSGATGRLAANYDRAVESASTRTSSEQLDVVYNDTDTEQDEFRVSEQSELEEQTLSARHVHVPDKEQTETEVEPSVRESLAVRQQSDPELGKLVRLRVQSAEQPALALLSTESESKKDCIINSNARKYEKGSYDEESREAPASSLTRSYSFPVSQFKTCSAPVSVTK